MGPVISLVIAIALLTQSPNVYATSRVCRILNYACGTSSSGSTGKSYPASSDSYGNNPSSIPTGKTPIGIEILYGEDFAYGLFKGYGKFGMAGGSLSKENSFFSNASNIKAAGIDLDRDLGDDINKKNHNFGLAFALFKKSLRKYMVPSIGLGVRYYRDNEHFRGSYGISFASDKFHFGGAIARTDYNFPLFTGNIGFQWNRISFDFTYLKNLEGVANRTQIYSIIWQLGKKSKWTLIGAWRTQDVEVSKEETANMQALNQSYDNAHSFFGVQYKIGKLFAIGGYLNYVLGHDPYAGLRITLGRI